MHKRVKLNNIFYMLITLSLFMVSCAPKKYIFTSVADSLSSGSSSWTKDNDPELILESLPISLLALEGIAEKTPYHVGIHTALASAFASYAYVGADTKSELIKYENYELHKSYQELARKRYLRGKKWGLKGLSIKNSDIENILKNNIEKIPTIFEKSDVPLLYWTSANWLAAISISTDQVDLIAELPQASSLIYRAYNLDPSYDNGALYEILISLEMSLNGQTEKGVNIAKGYYEKALELSQGRRASVFLTYATSIAVKQQDRKTFVELLEKVLALDPDKYIEYRLVNILSQRKAKYLLNHQMDLFDEDTSDATVEEK